MTTEEFLGIYRKNIAALYGFVSRRTGADRELTEDIVQETFLRAVREWSSRSRPDHPTAWLKAVAKNLVIDHFRRNGPGQTEALEIDPIDGSGAPPSYQEAALVHWGLSRLRREQVRLIEWFHFEEKSVRQIAEELGISERAVEGRLRRARIALREQLRGAFQQGREV